MNDTNRVWFAIFLVVAFIFAVIAAWQSNLQSQENTKNTYLLKRIAIANGIDPNHTNESLTNLSLKKQLGTESINLSKDIFDFLDKKKAFEYKVPHRNSFDQDTWEKDTQEIISSSSQLMSAYDMQFSAKVLSLVDRITQLKLAQFTGDEQSYFKYPTNPLGIKEVANILGKTGNNLLAEEQNQQTSKP